VGRDRDRGLPRRHHRLAQHTAFERREGSEWFVRDVGSLNGVCDEQVDETKLATGDEVQIGRFKLTFFSAGE
jgi:pSer/pThr/pTyr-binding forkhead associated (FHA) protein